MPENIAQKKAKELKKMLEEGRTLDPETREAMLYDIQDHAIITVRWSQLSGEMKGSAANLTILERVSTIINNLNKSEIGVTGNIVLDFEEPR